MPVDYLINAADCPALQVASGLLDPATSNPPVALQLTTGGSRFDIITASKDHGVRADALSRYGGGWVGICEGLGITDGGGLTVAVADGSALVDGLVTVTSAAPVALSDNVTNYLWLGQNKSITPTTSVTPPVGLTCFLGAVVTLSGSITSIDLSGVMFLRPLPWRKTGDAGVPGDTPPARSFLAETAGGLWLWDSAAYRRWVDAGVAVADVDGGATLGTLITAFNDLLASLRGGGGLEE